MNHIRTLLVLYNGTARKLLKLKRDMIIFVYNSHLGNVYFGLINPNLDYPKKYNLNLHGYDYR